MYTALNSDYEENLDQCCHHLNYVAGLDYFVLAESIQSFSNRYNYFHINIVSQLVGL